MRTVFLLLMLALTACGGSRALAPVGSYTTPATQTKYASVKAPLVYKVRKGDTLHSISWRYGMDYKVVAKINNIRSPYLLAIGQKLRFKTNKPTSKPSSPVGQSKPVKPQPVNNVKLTWQWPTKGTVISTYSNSVNGRKGINISGKSGQAIVAAATGKVVYSGNGLPRYGNLLIIKHGDTYLSAYAHNTKLLVKEGDFVRVGQNIATLGRTGAQKNQLHFEIRRNGKPVDPMHFLPKI